MLRVAAGELPGDAHGSPGPGTTVAFAKRDAVADGLRGGGRALRASTASSATLRLAGGRAAVFHDGTMEIGHAVPDDEPRAGIHERFERTAGPAGASAGAARRGRPRGRGARRVLPRPLQRERPRRGASSPGIGQRDRRRRVAHRHGARGRGRGAHQRGAASRSTRRSGSTGSPRRPVVRTEAPSARGTRSATRSWRSTPGLRAGRGRARRGDLELAQSCGEHRSRPGRGARSATRRGAQPLDAAVRLQAGAAAALARSAFRHHRVHEASATARAAGRGPSRGSRSARRPGSPSRWRGRRGTARAGRPRRGSRRSARRAPADAAVRTPDARIAASWRAVPAGWWPRS